MSASAPKRQLSICGLTELGAFRDASVTHVLSILDPGFPEPSDFAEYGPHKRLTLRFDDVIEPGAGLTCRRSRTTSRRCSNSARGSPRRSTTRSATSSSTATRGFPAPPPR